MYETYRVDIPLFNELGFEIFTDAPHAEYIDVGKHTTESGDWVEVQVQCWPAQFWKFNIYSSESEETYEITTGSGNMAGYWPIVEKIMQGMITIKVPITEAI